MNLLKLEDAQGLTPEIMRAHLEAKGWKRVDGRVWWRDQTTIDWYPPGSGMMAFYEPLTTPSEMIHKVAKFEKRTIQAILREMNPRFRKGIPSEAARAAHPGPWIVKTLTGGLLVGKWRDDPRLGLVVDSFGQTLQANPEWSYWPADEEASKVPWPEKDGVLL